MKVRIGIRLPENDLIGMKEVSLRERTSVTQLAQEVISEYINDHEKLLCMFSRRLGHDCKHSHTA